MNPYFKGRLYHTTSKRGEDIVLETCDESFVWSYKHARTIHYMILVWSMSPLFVR